MPVSKNGTLYFTAEQKEIADRNSSALDYAMSQGYELVRQNSYYKMKEHDSMVFTSDGFWFWNSRNLHGRAPEFIMEYEGHSFVEAVLILAGETVPGRANIYTPPVNPIANKSQNAVPFELPEQAKDSRQLFGYLCKSRMLSTQVVKEMLEQKILYQSSHTAHSGKTVHNACFVSYDDLKKPCSVFQRGLSTLGTPYKREVPGGDKSYGWVFHGKHPTKLYVFEAAIDAASFVSLGESHHKQPLAQADYLALGGLTFEPVARYLQTHPDIQAVHLMLDNDSAGRDASARFQCKLEEMGIYVEDHVPPAGKDWNEYLQITMGKDHSPEQRPPPDRLPTLRERREMARQQLAKAPLRPRREVNREQER